MTAPLPQHLEELIAGYVLGNLDPEEVKEVEQLLADNPGWLAEVDRLQETLALMPYGLPQVSPSPQLRSTILDAAAQPTLIKVNRSPRIWMVAIAGIPALLAICFGWESYRLRQDLLTAQVQILQQKDAIAMLEQPSTSLVSLKGMDVASAASGNMVMTPGQSQAMLVVQNMPPLPEGKVYYLWAVSGDKKLPCGAFKAGSHGNVVAKFPLPDSSEIQALTITIENSPAATEPAGPMVMTSGV
jgi:anti-sigma-K factor RskA